MSNWETNAAIQAVLNGYSGAAARLDTEEYLSFFTEDAEFRGVPEMVGLPAPFKGRERIGGRRGGEVPVRNPRAGPREQAVVARSLQRRWHAGRGLG